jgi:hypothetical protein
LLKCIICGPEHSGTTLISDLLRQVPGIDAGFEVGVLLAQTPRAFPDMPPFADITLWGWGIDRDTLIACCATDDFSQFYTRLAAASTVLRPGTRWIFDKTPRYLTELQACMNKSEAPFVVVVKDPRALVHSDYLKAGEPDFETWFDAYAPEKIGYLRTHYANYQQARDQADPRICLLRLEDICLDARRTCERLYAHVGCAFDPAYMILQGVRYENTRHGAISAAIPFRYRTRFNVAQQQRIAVTFAEFDAWFYA